MAVTAHHKSEQGTAKEFETPKPGCIPVMPTIDYREYSEAVARHEAKVEEMIKKQKQLYR